jgi:hypothetical protein
LDAWRQILERGVDEDPSRDKITKEAAQRFMLSFPEAGRKAFAAAKLPAIFGRDRLERDIAQGTSEGAQDSSVHGKDGTQGALQSDIVFNGR